MNALGIEYKEALETEEKRVDASNAFLEEAAESLPTYRIKWSVMQKEKETARADEPPITARDLAIMDLFGLIEMVR